MFDAGVNWIRIGQYENSSEPTGWDWVEQNRVKVQVQTLYGNPRYTSPGGRLPDVDHAQARRFS